MTDSLQNAGQHVDETFWPPRDANCLSLSSNAETSVEAHLAAGKSTLGELAGLARRARNEKQSIGRGTGSPRTATNTEIEDEDPPFAGS